MSTWHEKTVSFYAIDWKKKQLAEFLIIERSLVVRTANFGTLACVTVLYMPLNYAVYTEGFRKGLLPG